MRKSELMEVLISISLAILLGLFGVRYSYDHLTGAVSCDQETYIENMVDNWLFEGKELLPDVITKQGTKRQVNPTKIPMVGDADLDSIPISEKPDLVYIFKVQKLIGELMFLGVNTSPEISYALSVYRVT